jgi:hypothetical protein
VKRYNLLVILLLGLLITSCKKKVEPNKPAKVVDPYAGMTGAQKADAIRAAACSMHEFSNWTFGCYDIWRDQNSYGDLYGPYHIKQHRVCSKCGLREEQVHDESIDPMPGCEDQQ